MIPLDVLGRKRATLIKAARDLCRKAGGIRKLYRAGDSPLQLLDFNEEFLVSASH